LPNPVVDQQIGTRLSVSTPPTTTSAAFAKDLKIFPEEIEPDPCATFFTAEQWDHILCGRAINLDAVPTISTFDHFGQNC